MIILHTIYLTEEISGKKKSEFIDIKKVEVKVSTQSVY